MKLPKIYVDGFLVEWEAGEYQSQVKSMRQASKTITPSVLVPASTSAKGRRGRTTAERAQAVRDRLARTVRKVPEVMVKITSSCRGMTHIGRHIDYISRKGEIDLEDQDGLFLKGRDQLKDLKEDWRWGGVEEISAVSDRRDTLNIVFSMPAHTDEVSMKRAVRAFAAAEFQEHQYVFAYHTQATDPDPNPPAHPHVHLSVKTQSRSGRRLNPRKADLQRWREGFAAQLRAHGIDANATSRLARLNRKPGVDRGALAIASRKGSRGEGEPGTADNGRLERARKLETGRINYYRTVVDVLARSEDPADRGLAAKVSEFISRFGPKPDRTVEGEPKR
ncbi:MAG: relaxase/mobilization nuclease domain-containing protein [Asticcacaulis sp.]|uniref:relaxase/mobilization nuclease domain-containing protein n=1 Tax=Asticcacaulis sp. TaxID=1872648 RepID=UPI003F7C2DD9